MKFHPAVVISKFYTKIQKSYICLSDVISIQNLGVFRSKSKYMCLLDKIRKTFKILLKESLIVFDLNRLKSGFQCYCLSCFYENFIVL